MTDEMLRRAYTELEESLAAARRRAKEFRGSCETCRFHSISKHKSMKWVLWEKCSHPLAGRFQFDEQSHSEKFEPLEIYDRYLGRDREEPSVCGRNHVLWQPRPTLIERAIGWLFGAKPNETNNVDGIKQGGE